jgi:hypothetical protein
MTRFIELYVGLPTFQVLNKGHFSRPRKMAVTFSVGLSRGLTQWIESLYVWKSYENIDEKSTFGRFFSFGRAF